MHWKERAITEVWGGGVEVVGIRAEVGARKRVGEGEVSVGVTRHHRMQALAMYHVAHRALFRDHLSVHAVAVYLRSVWG